MFVHHHNMLLMRIIRMFTFNLTVRQLHNDHLTLTLDEDLEQI